LVKEVVEDGGGIQLARAADGRVPGQVLVHFVAQEIENIQPQGALFD
jgi:hypothetical protein